MATEAAAAACVAAKQLSAMCGHHHQKSSHQARTPRVAQPARVLAPVGAWPSLVPSLPGSVAAMQEALLSLFAAHAQATGLRAQKHQLCSLAPVPWCWLCAPPLLLPRHHSCHLWAHLYLFRQTGRAMPPLQSQLASRLPRQLVGSHSQQRRSRNEPQRHCSMQQLTRMKQPWKQ